MVDFECLLSLVNLPRVSAVQIFDLALALGLKLQKEDGIVLLEGDEFVPRVLHWVEVADARQSVDLTARAESTQAIVINTIAPLGDVTEGLSVSLYFSWAVISISISERLVSDRAGDRAVARFIAFGKICRELSRVVQVRCFDIGPELYLPEDVAGESGPRRGLPAYSEEAFSETELRRWFAEYTRGGQIRP